MSIQMEKGRSWRLTKTNKRVTVMSTELRMDDILQFWTTFQSIRPLPLAVDESFNKALCFGEDLIPHINEWLKKRSRAIYDAMKETEGFLDAETTRTPTLFQPVNGSFHMTEESESLPILSSLTREPSRKDVIHAIFQLTLWSGFHQYSEDLFQTVLTTLQSRQKKMRISTPKMFQFILCYYHWSAHMTRIVYHAQVHPYVERSSPCLQICFFCGSMKSTFIFFRNLLYDTKNCVKFTFPNKMVINENIVFDNVLTFTTGSFISMTNLKFSQQETTTKAPTIADNYRALKICVSLLELGEQEDFADEEVNKFRSNSVEQMAKFIREFAEQVESNHSLRDLVHWSRKDDEKAELDRHFLRTAVLGAHADEESSEDVDESNSIDEGQYSYPMNPFIDEEAAVKDSESEVSEEDHFDTVDDVDCVSRQDKVPDNQHLGYNGGTAIVPVNLFNPSGIVDTGNLKDLEDEASAADYYDSLSDDFDGLSTDDKSGDNRKQNVKHKMSHHVKRNLSLLHQHMSKFINFSVVDSKIDDEGANAALATVTSLIEECNDFYTAFRVQPTKTISTVRKAFLPLWVHHSCSYNYLPGESSWTNMIRDDILAQSITNFQSVGNIHELQRVIENLLEACLELEDHYIMECVYSLGRSFREKNPIGLGMDITSSDETRPQSSMCLQDVGFINIGSQKTCGKRHRSMENKHKGEEMEVKLPRRSPRKTKNSQSLSLAKSFKNGEDVYYRKSNQGTKSSRKKRTQD